MKVADIVDGLDFEPLAGVEPLHVGVGHLTVEIRTAEPLRGVLAAYFTDALTPPASADAVVEILDGQRLDPEPGWIDWAREPGKTGRKDAYCDLEDGRLVHKVRTGVTFLQSPARLLAFGPVVAHPNQVINFVNTQMLNICQQQGWQICHAAAVTDGTQSLAIAGLSGGGKSTATLRLLDLDSLAYMSGDRLLVRAGNPPRGLGIPKLPRINPGTILGNPRLHKLLSPTRRAELAAMPSDELWRLEEKHDLQVGQIYGANRVRFEAPLTDFWVLDWQRDSAEPTRIEPVDIAARPDLLGAIMKSPGPFYQKPDGSFLRDDEAPDPAGYLEALEGIEISEVRGRVDFDALFEAGKALFARP